MFFIFVAGAVSQEQILGRSSRKEQIEILLVSFIQNNSVVRVSVAL